MKFLKLFVVAAVMLGMTLAASPNSKAVDAPKQTKGYKCQLQNFVDVNWMTPQPFDKGWLYSVSPAMNTTISVWWWPWYDSELQDPMHDLVSILVTTGNEQKFYTYDGPAITTYDFTSNTYSGGTYTAKCLNETMTVSIWYVP